MSVLVGCSAMAADNDGSTTRNSSEHFVYDVISEEQSQELKAVRDAYGSIPNLESIYEDRIHSNGLPYHAYFTEGFMDWLFAQQADGVSAD